MFTNTIVFSIARAATKSDKVGSLNFLVLSCGRKGKNAVFITSVCFHLEGWRHDNKKLNKFEIKSNLNISKIQDTKEGCNSPK